QLREVDVIAHVIRVFEDASVPHSEGSIDPLRDATNLDLELMLSDHDQIVRRLERVEKDLKKKRDPALELEKTVLEKCKAQLEAEKPLREVELTSEERKSIGGFLFLSARPVLYVLNLGDEEADKLDTAVERHKLGALQGKKNAAVVPICGRLEAELAEMVRWKELVGAGSIAAGKEKAEVRLEGKEYVVQEGDVILFRHSGRRKVASGCRREGCKKNQLGNHKGESAELRGTA